MAGSSNWIFLYDKTSAQVTRRVWDDENELTLQHPAAVPLPNETALLVPTATFMASAQAAAANAYVIEVDPTIMGLIANDATVKGNAVAAVAAQAIAAATNALIAANATPPGTGGGSVGNAVP